ncbi:MAG TPA: hypothetical protein VII46_07910 [Acidimicrobiales bacterium]
MDQHQTREEKGELSAASERVGPEWAERATASRQREWSSDRVVDPGDTHDKGEPSLCVGEAA